MIELHRERAGRGLRGARRMAAIVALGSCPLLMGAKGCTANSTSEAPDASGSWAIAYDDSLGVEVTIGGAVYTETLGAAGGSFTIDHDGLPITFDLDCARPEIVCPSEAWPATVDIEHRNDRFPHRMWVRMPRQECPGSLVDAAPEDCGAGTQNPDCDQVCDSELQTVTQDVFAVIDEAGESFDMLLGAGVASNGINCALLGVSSAHADLVTRGSADGGDWEAYEMENGEVVVAYAGACLWAADVDMDATLEAAVRSASVRFTTGFTGQKR